VSVVIFNSTIAFVCVTGDGTAEHSRLQICLPNLGISNRVEEQLGYTLFSNFAQRIENET